MTAPGDSEPPSQPPSADNKGFDQRLLDRTVIAIPLLEAIAAAKPEEIIDVVIDMNLTYPGGRERARERVRDLVAAAVAPFKGGTLAAFRSDEPGNQMPFIGVDVRKSQLSDQYVFASLPADAIKSLIRLDTLGGKRANSASKVIYRVWPDFPLEVLLTSSVRTVKADAALTAFAAAGGESCGRCSTPASTATIRTSVATRISSCPRRCVTATSARGRTNPKRR